jgi:hypothetical protein
VDQGAHPGDEQRHGDREGVGQEGDVHAEPAGGDPLEEGLDEPAVLAVLAQQAQVHHDRGEERPAARRGGQPAGEGLAEAAAQGDEGDEPGEGQRGDEPDEVEHAGVLSP